MITVRRHAYTGLYVQLKTKSFSVICHPFHPDCWYTPKLIYTNNNNETKELKLFERRN